MNEILTQKWKELRGLAIVSVAINSITAPKEDEDMIKQLQKNAALRDPTMAAANLVGAQADAMRTAAANESGAMNGFVGMGMAMNVGGAQANNLFSMGQQQQAQNAQPAAQPQTSGMWTCSCGTQNSGKFCQNCGARKPDNGAWTCSCGTQNTGNFCQNCGAKRP